MLENHRLAEGVNFFNAGRYFEAHEVWEDLWRELQGSRRQLCQGLIQAAVGLHHFQRQNSRGGRLQVQKAIANLSANSEGSLGLDLADLIRQLGEVLQGDPVQVRISRLK